MQKLTRGVMNALPFEEFYRQNRQRLGELSEEDAHAMYQSVLSEEVWLNDIYQVNVNKKPTHGFAPLTVWHLSIKRRDKEAIHDWRDLQEIKNQLCGSETEAIELYPSEARLVDTANQYHLFAFVTPGFTLPVGFHSGRLVTDDSGVANTKQRART